MDAILGSVYSLMSQMGFGHFVVILLILIAVKFIFKVTKAVITIAVIIVAFNIFCVANTTMPLLDSGIIKQKSPMVFSLYDKEDNQFIDSKEIKTVKFDNETDDLKLVIVYKDSDKKNTTIKLDKNLKDKVESVLNSLSISTE
jgi:hypothetical protein